MLEPRIAPQVKEKSLQESRPIVALESAVLTHGLPYPENVETAIKLESIIAEEGAVPATIAIYDGELRVGLTREEIEALATRKDTCKVSRRDIAAVVAANQSGGTTVAGTMAIAQMAGVNFFVTGGIGGVHRGADKSFDISADLQEFSRTAVAVIAAGTKSILDIKLTLERLETLGVPVLGFKTAEFPAFYYNNSGYEVSQKVNSYQDAAQIVKVQQELGLDTGVLIANPIPQADSLARDKIETAIEQALKTAEKQELTGSALTPFLLEELKDITAGRSLEANISLLENNAKVGANIALAYRRLLTQTQQ